jgi:hypothetical protein
MSEICFVFPNLSGFKPKNSRGRLLNRWDNAKQHGFNLVEVPANFVKENEAKFLGLNKCEFLTKEAVNKLYSKNNELPSDIKYILHTEFKCSLKWYNESWVEQFIKMNIDISRHLGSPPTMIEIHPGKKSNTYQNIAESAIKLFNEFRSCT